MTEGTEVVNHTVSLTEVHVNAFEKKVVVALKVRAEVDYLKGHERQHS